MDQSAGDNFLLFNTMTLTKWFSENTVNVKKYLCQTLFMQNAIALKTPYQKRYRLFFLLH
ncbi:hypothetical protein BV921_05735 [Pectobacterium odoriferum]|nr:hypothetical protein BV921_05735 [Pectobacterium odoriferum]